MKKRLRQTRIVVVLTALLAMSFHCSFEIVTSESGLQVIRIGIEKMSTILPDIVYRFFG